VTVNQVDIVDVDAISQTVRGTSWAHVYSPAADTYDLSLSPSSKPWGDAKAPVAGVLTAWQGLPGRGFGGLNGEPTRGLLSHEYQLNLVNREAKTLQTSLQDVMIPVHSTKSLVSRWWGEGGFAAESNLTANMSHDDILRGSLSNPLDVELQDCLVLFGASVYVLDQSLKPKETLALDSFSSKRRDLERRWTRRRLTHDQKETIIPWDEGGQDLPRILEVMMFHEAAGGQPYTKLGNRFQSYVDLSEHLRLGRAILLGKAEAPATDWMRNGKALEDASIKNWTYYRVVFPVTQTARKERPKRDQDR
jgi:hypothetical protein